MKREHAEEFTDALGQVFAGGMRLAGLADELGIPAALGLTEQQWLERRLAGAVRLDRDERRQIVEANPDASSRELGDALGVDHQTILNDRAALAGENSPASPPTAQGEPATTGENSPPEDHRLGFMLSSASDEWETPQPLFDALDAEFRFTLDVCATDATAKCSRYYAPEDDGLAQRWTGRCWMNPPFGFLEACCQPGGLEDACRLFRLPPPRVTRVHDTSHGAPTDEPPPPAPHDTDMGAEL